MARYASPFLSAGMPPQTQRARAHRVAPTSHSPFLYRTGH